MGFVCSFLLLSRTRHSDSNPFFILSICLNTTYFPFFCNSNWPGILSRPVSAFWALLGLQPFFFLQFIWWFTLTGFPMLSHPCISRIKASWSWWIIFLMHSWIQFVSILLSIFCIHVHKGNWSFFFFLSGCRILV